MALKFGVISAEGGLDGVQKLQEGADPSALGPSEVESAEDFIRATALRHRYVFSLLHHPVGLGVSNQGFISPKLEKGRHCHDLNWLRGQKYL